MFYHIRPKIYCRNHAVLTDLTIPEMGLKLDGGRELDTKQPYPNKMFKVASRKGGRKAVDGILVETNSFIRYFSYLARWMVDGSMLVEHTVSVTLDDEEFDLASDDPKLQLGFPALGWTVRRPAETFAVAANALDARMEFESGSSFVFQIPTEDSSGDGMIFARRQSILIPTIEMRRLQEGPLTKNPPLLKDSFKSEI